MAYPFGGIELALLEKVLVERFGVEAKFTDNPVDTLDGRKTQAIWISSKDNRFAERPEQKHHNISPERVAHISRRLGIDYNELINNCLSLNNEHREAVETSLEDTN